MNAYFQISCQSLILLIKIYVFNKFRTNQLIKELNEYLNKFDLDLNKNQIKRIHFYTIQSCITNSWFCMLRGKKANSIERKHAIYLGAITPLLDDLVDLRKLNSIEIINLIQNGKSKNSTEILLIRYLYGKLLKDCTANFKLQFNQALKSQDISLKQLERQKLSESELFEITKNKGANWTLLYRTILKNELQHAEKEAISTLGELLQLTNDAFDVFKDFKNGQQTVFTNCYDLSPIYKQFNDLIWQMIEQFSKTEFSRKNTKRSIIQIMLVVSRGIVCLEQLLECQKRTHDLFQIEKYRRKELICDMEKPINIIKLFKTCKYQIESQ